MAKLFQQLLNSILAMAAMLNYSDGCNKDMAKFEFSDRLNK